MACSGMPSTGSQWSLCKITGPVWPSHAKNFLHTTCGRRRTHTSTLLTPVKNKLEVSRLQSLLLFEVFLYPMGRVSCGFAFTLLYLSKSVPPLTSVQQHSLCSAASCLSLCFNKFCCLDKFLDQAVAPKIPDS
jgi:hypothetical protein